MLSTGGGAGVLAWELVPKGTRHCHYRAPFGVVSFACYVLQNGGGVWALAGLCILCIHGGWLLQGQQPAPNKVVSI